MSKTRSCSFVEDLRGGVGVDMNLLPYSPGKGMARRSVDQRGSVDHSHHST